MHLITIPNRFFKKVNNARVLMYLIFDRGYEAVISPVNFGRNFNIGRWYPLASITLDVTGTVITVKSHDKFLMTLEKYIK